MMILTSSGAQLRMLLIAAAVAVTVTAPVPAHSQIGSSAAPAERDWGGHGAGPGMMGGHGYGPGPGMMGGYGYGPGPGMMGGYGYGPGPGMMGGYGCGMGPGMMGGYGYGMGYGYDRELGLTDDQVARIARIRDEVRRTHWSLMGAMMDTHVKLRDLYAAPKRDDAAIDEAYKTLAKLQRQMVDSTLDAQKRMDAVLTKEQRQKQRSFFRPND